MNLERPLHITDEKEKLIKRKGGDVAVCTPGSWRLEGYRNALSNYSISAFIGWILKSKKECLYNLCLSIVSRKLNKIQTWNLEVICIYFSRNQKLYENFSRMIIFGRFEFFVRSSFWFWGSPTKIRAIPSYIYINIYI